MIKPVCKHPTLSTFVPMISSGPDSGKNRAGYVVPDAIQEISPQIDYLHLLCRGLSKRPAHIMFWRLSALDIDPCALASNYLCELCANSRHKSDAGAAKGGYRICCGSDELLWRLHGKHWHDHNIPELERHNFGTGRDECPDGTDGRSAVAAHISKAVCNAGSRKIYRIYIYVNYHGMKAAVVGNIFINTKKQASTYSPEHFYPAIIGHF